MLAGCSFCFSLLGWAELGSNVPVDKALPDGVVHAVEEVKKHGSHVARGSPVGRHELARGNSLRGDISTSVPLLPGIATAPDRHRQSEEHEKPNTGTDTAADLLNVQEGPDQSRSDDLGEPVQEAVQRLGAGVEVGGVDAVLLVGVEPVGGPEHGEEKDDVGLGPDGVPQADDLGLPAWVLHEDDAGAVWTHDLVCVAEEEGKASAKEHEDNEGDVGAVADVAIGLDVDVFSEGDLDILLASSVE